MQALPPDSSRVIVLESHPAVVGPHQNNGAGSAGRHLGQICCTVGRPLPGLPANLVPLEGLLHVCIHVALVALCHNDYRPALHVIQTHIIVILSLLSHCHLLVAVTTAVVNSVDS